MLALKKKNTKVDLNLNDRFHNEVNQDNKILSAANQFKSLGFLKTNLDLVPGQVLTANFLNSFKLDIRSNLSFFYHSLSVLSKEISTSTKFADKSIRYIYAESKKAAIDLKETYIRQISSENTIIKLNTFVRKNDLIYHVKENSPLLQDPLTKVSFRRNFICSNIQNVGLTLPIINSTNIVITSFERDFSDSYIGHSFLSETSPNSLLEKKPYHISFINRISDKLSNKYINQSGYSISFWLNFGGIQVLNKLLLQLSSNIKITAISYLDQNENETDLDFTAAYSDDAVSLLFQTITAKSIKLKLVLQVPSDRTFLQEEFGDVYNFCIDAVDAFYIKYQPTGYFLSQPIPVNKLSGFKFKSSAELKEKYSVDSYIKIEELSANNNVSKYVTIPLLSSYSNINDFPLHFVHNKTELNFYPKIDGSFSLYKNEIILTPGTDYWFFTDKDSSQSDTIPSITNSHADKLYIELNTYDSTARYTAKYKCDTSLTYKNLYKLNFDSITLLKPIKKSRVYILSIIRQTIVDSLSLPFYKSYLLELYYE